MKSLTIRQAYGNDIGAIAELWMELVEEHRELDSRFPMAVEGGEERYAEFVHQCLMGRSGVVFIAEANGEKVIAYIFALLSDPYPPFYEQKPGGTILDLYVHPSVRRRGVGHRLYREVVGWLAEQNVETVVWEVAAKNDAALAFWEAVGGDVIVSRFQQSL